LWSVAIPLLVAGSWGLYQAGYAVGSDGQSSARDDARELQRRVSSLERRNRELMQRNAQLERDQVISREAVNRIRDSIQDMESRHRAMEEELTFYRSIVSPENVESGLHIHSLALEPVGRDGEYVYRVVLTQIRGSGTVEGTLEFRLVGRQGASRVEFGGAELGDDLQGIQEFGFRYFQNLEGRIRIPAGVTPRSLRVLARTDGDRPRQVEQDYAWEATLKPSG
jgi:hypothetical protein